MMGNLMKRILLVALCFGLVICSTGLAAAESNQTFAELGADDPAGLTVFPGRELSKEAAA